MRGCYGKKIESLWDLIDKIERFLPEQDHEFIEKFVWKYIPDETSTEIWEVLWTRIAGEKFESIEEFEKWKKRKEKMWEEWENEEWENWSDEEWEEWERMDNIENEDEIEKLIEEFGYLSEGCLPENPHRFDEEIDFLLDDYTDIAYIPYEITEWTAIPIRDLVDFLLHSSRLSYPPSPMQLYYILESIPLERDLEYAFTVLATILDTAKKDLESDEEEKQEFEEELSSLLSSLLENGYDPDDFFLLLSPLDLEEDTKKELFEKYTHFFFSKLEEEEGAEEIEI